MLEDALQFFLDDGSISEVLYQLKSDKEATVWLCRAGSGLAAAKIYRSHGSHGFNNDVVYRVGRAILEDRVARAVYGKTRFGREAAKTMWLGQEYQMLRTLFRAGIDVPRPLAAGEGGVLMSAVMLNGRPAPQLREAPVSDARPIFERLLNNIEDMLANDVIHGDLSPFNVLLGDEGPVIIDLPQAVDPRMNPNARELLFRDVESICRWAGRYGIQENGFMVADDLWSRWERAML